MRRVLLLVLVPLATAAAVWSGLPTLSAHSPDAPQPTVAVAPHISVSEPQTWERIVDALIGEGLNKSELVRTHCGLDQRGHFLPRELPELSQRLEQLDAGQREAVERVSREHRDALLALASNAMDELQIALAAAIETGVVEVTPLRSQAEAHAQVQARAARRVTSAAYSTTFTVGGWLVSVTLDGHTSPRFAQALHDFSVARQAHDDDVVRLLDTL
jgi:hypothetical protein